MNKLLIKKCDKILNDFYEKAEIEEDIFRKTRKMPVPKYRALFYYILKKKLKLADDTIADYVLHKGFKIDRSAIWHGINKLHEKYYKKDYLISYVYDLYFDDKSKERETKLRKSIYNQRYNKFIPKNSRVSRLLKGVPDDKMDEICDLIELRVKSWNWKNKDKTKIYEGGLNLSKMVY